MRSAVRRTVTAGKTALVDLIVKNCRLFSRLLVSQALEMKLHAGQQAEPVSVATVLGVFDPVFDKPGVNKLQMPVYSPSQLAQSATSDRIMNGDVLCPVWVMRRLSGRYRLGMKFSVLQDSSAAGRVVNHVHIPAPSLARSFQSVVHLTVVKTAAPGDIVER